MRRKLADLTGSVVPYNLEEPREREPVASSYELRNRRRPRQQELLDAIAAIDARTDPAERKKLIKWIEDAYADRGGGVLLGLFGRCYLGDPYLDHRMSPSADILEHFKGSETPPLEYAAARPLARSPHYLFIEVYSDGQMVPIRPDGTPAV